MIAFLQSFNACAFFFSFRFCFLFHASIAEAYCSMFYLEHLHQSCVSPIYTRTTWVLFGAAQAHSSSKSHDGGFMQVRREEEGKKRARTHKKKPTAKRLILFLVNFNETQLFRPKQWSHTSICVCTQSGPYAVTIQVSCRVAISLSYLSIFTNAMISRAPAQVNKSAIDFFPSAGRSLLLLLRFQSAHSFCLSIWIVHLHIVIAALLLSPSVFALGIPVGARNHE